ncbi:poly(ADP-ribose) polymerase isoform X2 [Tasmannia lanceolata]|uniref:poly(ADP-ribose) polymerase isoform X2 n=1 Tax=Tasmannia lanceolata TaxID=3420 RepID=UPI004064A02C
MSAKLKVEELRTQLAQRGLDTDGTKPTLVRRLEAALCREKNPSKDVKNEDVNVTKKRPRETVNGDSLELREMGVRQLREQAILRGVSASGSKRELVERLSVDMEKGSEDISEDKEVNGNTEEKLITATKKGGAVLDQWLPDHIKSNYHVLQHVESDDNSTFMVYNRWGRVGVKGQDKLHGPFISRDDAINEFQLRFFAKTKNHWSDRKEFICYPKYYTWLEMDYSEAEKETVLNNCDDSVTGIQPRETQLDSRLAKFISLICNISMMKQQMLEIGYNAEKLPLGKLSKSTIMKGYDVLKRISDAIGQSDRRKLELLSGEFYTVIPHDFGFKKMSEFVIDSPLKLKCKLQLVEALGEIEVATRLLKDDLDTQDDPLYSHYQRLRCDLIPVEVDSSEFSMIEKYMQNTHAKTHSNYTVDIVHIFKVSRQGEFEHFQKFSGMKNRMLLWHGSRLTNWTGILSQGLRVAPSEAPVTGYMFGKGVYFADMFSKSANYCYSSQTSRAGVLLLCEVALGEMAEELTANYNADQLPPGKLSTKGIGGTAPDSSEFQKLEDGVVVPLGKPKEQAGPKGSLLYNEYIVYNVDQIRMRYLIQVNFSF